jgi:hypothetical protein
MSTEPIDFTDLVALEERRLTALRDRLQDYRLAAADARGALDHAERVAALERDLPLDGPFLLGMTCALPLTFAILMLARLA